MPGCPLCADAEHKPIEKNKKINGNLDILVAPSGSISRVRDRAPNVGTMLRYPIFKQMDSFRLRERPPNSDHLIAVMTCLFVHRRRPNYLSLETGSNITVAFYEAF